MKTAVFLYNPESGKGKIARNVGCISTIFQAYGYDVTPQKIDFTANPFDGNETIDRSDRRYYKQGKRNAAWIAGSLGRRCQE